MRVLYSIGICVYTLGVRLASLWMEKARLMVRGWRGTWRELRVEKGLCGELSVFAWFHASSLGEFEQARPVMEQFRREHPECKILLTFFSPSGYEVRKHYEGADWVCYLPMDTPGNARRFVREVNPSVVFFVKYDFFFNYLRELRGRGVPTYIFSAIFRPGHYFFQWYGGWFLKQLHCYTHLFVQNEESLQLLQNHGISHCSLAGDTRFDRVDQIARQALGSPASPIGLPQAILHPEVEAFIGDNPVLMAGSSWMPDEVNIKHFVEHYDGRLKLILAPHVIDEAHLQQIEALFGQENCVRYSQLSIVNSQQSTLIIDNFGMLSSLYRYATVAYVGGAFGHGLHNILEALTFGKPVAFGPKYEKFQEAKDILARGGGFTYTRPEALAERLTLWLTDGEAYRQASLACRAYVEENLGSTQKILASVEAEAAPCRRRRGRRGRPRGRMWMLGLGIGLGLGLVSCGPSRYLAEGERVLRANRYEVLMEDGGQPPKEVAEALKGMRKYADQKPNPSFLGVRWGMRVYCLPEPSDNGHIANYLRRKGSRPVVHNPQSPYRTAEQLRRLLESKGCFTSTVDFDTTRGRGRDVTVTYRLRPSPRYRLAQVDYHCATPEVDRMLARWKEDSPLRVGAYYDADLVAAERTRLTTLMRDSGFYLASRELFTVYLDTANDDTTLNLTLLIDNPRVRDAQGNVQAVPLRRHHIDRILFYPGATLVNHDTLDYAYTMSNRTTGRRRTTHYLFLDPGHQALSPQVVARNMFLFHGQPYRDRNVEMTYNSLLGLRNFKYVNIEFTPSPRSSADSSLLDAHVRLIPAKRQRLTFSLEVNNSSSMSNITTTNGNFGLEGTLTYQNKNLFKKHSGLLTLDLSSLVELPKDLSTTPDGRRLAAIEFGTNATLDLPTLLAPFSGNLMWQRSRPHTLISLGGRYQRTSYLERTLFNLSYGYTWNRNRRSTHQLIPFELTYALVDADPDFVDRVTNGSSNARQVYQYKPHFILDARYTYTYSNQVFGSRQDFDYFTFTAESAGNLLWCLDQMLHFQQNADSVSSPLGVPYSQHVRLSTELKRYFYHGQKSTFVSRLLLGVGLPYGNSRGMQMPYEKSFFGGGPTTLRAWHLRRLGPGTHPMGDIQTERTGDIQFVLNLEERFPVAGALDGALFLDAGNVWLLYANESQPGANLSLRGLLPSMALGTGFGLRLNVSILTLRLDVGLPLYDPAYPSGSRFRPPHWSEYSRNLKDFSLGPATLNFGIDYPF